MAEAPALSQAERLWLSAFSTVLGALPDHVGQFRIASTYLRRRRPQSSQVLVQRMRSGLRASLDIADRTQGIAFLTRRYDPELVDYITRRVPAGGVFVDVGAHVGLISLAVARQRPTARIFAFEPHAANANAWLINRDLNGLANAELSRFAVADGAGRRTFHEAADSAAGYLSSGDGTTVVEVTSLDAFAAEHGIGHIDVLKIDTEGGERAVLDGAAALLSRGSVSAVICEFNTEHLLRQGQRAEDIVALLHDAGFHEVALPTSRSALRRRRADPPVVDVAFERSSGSSTRVGP
jgi:FkbM family methyltransferase